MVKMLIGNLCTWAKGFQVPRDNTSLDKPVPYLHYGDLYKKYDFRLDLDDVIDSIIKIDENSKVKPEQFLHDGDIVFTLTSETVDDLGHCTLVSNPSNIPFVSGMETTVFHIKGDAPVVPAYLNYCFQSVAFQRALRQYVTGMKVYRVHPDDIMNMELNVPPVSTQEAVVSILDSISDAIIIKSKLNDNLATLIDVIFKETKRSSDCQLIKLSELCTFISRGVSPKYNPNSDYYVLGQTCVRNHMILMSNARTLEDKSYGQKQVQKWDIMVNSTGIGSLGRVAQVGFDHPKLVADSHITIVRPKECYREYLGCQLVSMENEIENMAEGSTGQTELPRSRFSEIEIPVPSVDVLNIFSIKVRPLINMIYQNLESIKTLEQLRDYLLPKLMSGEIDVSALEIPS